MTPRCFALVAGLSFLLTAMMGCAVQPDVPYWAMEKGWQPEGAYAVKPSPMWLAEYQNAETCSGLKGNVAMVRWYIVPGVSFAGVTDDGHIIAFTGYSERGNIYIAESRKNFEWLIRHESLHDILQGGGHNMTLFGEKCKAYQGYLE